MNPWDIFAWSAAIAFSVIVLVCAGGVCYAIYEAYKHPKSKS